jgi:hypothetical protein
MKKQLFLLAITFVLFTSCLYQKEVDLKPKITSNNNTVVVCDTAAVTYSKNISAILKTNCYACHSDFESYDMVKANMTEIVKRINLPTSSTGFMPKGGTKLDDCAILQLNNWVNKGGQNN